VLASNQSWVLKLFVGIVMVVETIGTAATCAHLYIVRFPCRTASLWCFADEGTDRTA
jgi:hypothetical protein